jgi:hypothetical protein
MAFVCADVGALAEAAPGVVYGPICRNDLTVGLSFVKS